MASKRSSAGPRESYAQSDSDDTHSTPYIPPPPGEAKRHSSRRMSDFRRDMDRIERYPSIRHHQSGRRRHRDRGYSMPREKYGAKMTLVLSRYSVTSQHWSTASVTVDRFRGNDIDMWTDIRQTFRNDLQKPWRRIFGFRRVHCVMPITYTINGIPLRSPKSPEKFALGHALMHAYRHPQRLRNDRHWIEWFEDFERENGRDAECGLQFIETLWADKLAAVAILLTAAIIVVSAVWCARGGELQTVFTVMSFVLGGITAELALVALYFQVTSPG